MTLEAFELEAVLLPGAMPIWHALVDALEWRAQCERVSAKGGRLVALWGTDDTDHGKGFSVNAALALPPGMLVMTLPLAAESFPDVSDLFPVASRMQRATFDLLGLRADGARDQRKWLLHAGWPEGVFPLRKSFDGTQAYPVGNDGYAFVTVKGEGVHEMPVGPVHAGTIEPGHFRFSIVGEGILRLEERLGYAHKGIEKRFEQMTLVEGAKLAGRVSGDSTVAYAWAYAMAVESLTGVVPPPRALWLRALLLERERVGQHLSDLGHLGNDAGLAFGLAQFSRLREDWQRTNGALFGHRYLMDAIVPGGVTRDIGVEAVARMRSEIGEIKRTVALLREIYVEHSGLQDRFVNCGRIRQDVAEKLGLTGLAGRASGIARDLRVQIPTAPYEQLEVQITVRTGGDVAARATLRVEEIAESLRLIGAILSGMPAGDIHTALASAPENALGVGWVEGWRGEVMIAVQAGAGNRIRRCHPHDPSWQNWPLLERAVLGNILPDFPLINKSLNLSYSGQDL